MDAFGIAWLKNRATPIISFGLGAFTGQDMAGERKAAFDLAGPGFSEPLRGPSMGFHFGHSNLSRSLVPFTGGLKNYYCSRHWLRDVIS